MLTVNLRKSIVSSTFFSISHKVVNVVVKAVLAPLIISHIGLDGFGVWSLLIAVANYPRFGIGGVNAAFQKYVSDSTASGDFARTSRLLTTGSLMVVGFTLLVSVPLLVVTRVVVSFLNIPAEYTGSFAASLQILIVAIIFSNAGSAYSGIVAGAHRLELVKKIDIVWVLIEAVFTVVLLWRGFGLYALALPFATSQVGSVLSYAYFARKVLPEVSLRPRYVSRSVVGELLRFAGSFQALGALEMLYMTLVPMMVMRYFGAHVSGVYGAATRLASVSSIAAESILLPLLSGSAYAATMGERERSHRLFQYSLKFVVFSSLPLLLFVSACSDAILFAWTGERSELFMAAMVLLSGISLVSLIARHHMIVYRSMGERVYDLVWMVIRLGGFVVFGWLLARSMRFPGLLLGQLTGEGLGLAFMMLVIGRAVGVRYAAMAKGWGPQIVGFGLLGGAAWITVGSRLAQVASRWAALEGIVIAGLAYLLLAAGVVWLGLSAEERKAVQSLSLGGEGSESLRY